MENVNPYNVMIVDCYNLIYKASWLEPENIVQYGNGTFHTEGIIGFFKAINSYIERFCTSDVKIYWLLDNAKTSVTRYRKALSDTYKKNRKEQPEWFYREIDIIELILKYYRDNAELYRLKFLEADDYVNNILNIKIKDTDRVIMISEDSDWCRGLRDNVHQYKDKMIYTKEVFFNVKGYEATYYNICFDKTFYGDSTDNILPTLANFPKQFFMNVISRFNNVSQFIQAVKDNRLDYLDLGWREKIIKEENSILLNWNLVESAEISDTELSSYACQCYFKPNKLNIIYSGLNLLGKFDNRIKSNKSDTSIFSMLDGENLARQ